MQAEKLMLSWHEHHGTLVSIFESLLQSNTLVDCTLAAEGQCLKAHKVVLSACSPYFQMMFKEVSEKHPIVFLKDVKFQEVKAIVNFMYRGEVEICEDRLGCFLDIANSLQVKGLESNRNPSQLEGKILPASADEKPKRSINTVTSAPSKLLRKSQLLSRDQDDCVFAETTTHGKTKISSAEHSVHHQHTDSDTHFTATVSDASSFSLATSSFHGEVESQDERTLLEKNSLPVQFPSVEKFSSSSLNIKTEPESDSYQEQQSCFINEREREDFVEEASLIEDANEWIEPRPGSVEDQQYSNFSSAHVKTEDDVSDCMIVEENAEHSTSEGAVSSGIVNPMNRVQLKKREWGSRWQHHEDSRTNMDSGGQTVRVKEMKVLQADSQVILLSERFRCRVCQKLLSSSYSLKIHMRIHTGEKPYKCYMCDYAAAVACNLRKHLLIHTGERPFPCDVCGAAFSQIGTLRSHQMVHKRDQVFACSECNRKFVSSDSLRAHQKKQHVICHIVP